VASLRRALSRGEERADSVHQYLKDLEKSLSVAGGTGDDDGLELRGAFSARQMLAILQREAQKGVESIAIRPSADGSAWVGVDGGKELRLQPAPASLLGILAKQTKEPDGSLVGWKSLGEVATLLHAKTGRPYNRRGIRQLVLRLRNALTAHGLNRFLVQTSRQHGLRFALRQKPARVTE
jgi:hypothetical protein